MHGQTNIKLVPNVWTPKPNPSLYADILGDVLNKKHEHSMCSYIAQTTQIMIILGKSNFLN